MSGRDPGRLLCVFGTGSDVGKSWIATGICRILHQAGIDVAPYKAQNLSNNAGLTADGGELGRAQIVQAQACGLPPHVDMNPLLLKPTAGQGAQIVALGRALTGTPARAFFAADRLAERRRLVLDALDRLRAAHEVVVAEGAGSCAEVNLRDRDLVNMPVAHHGDGAVLLVADILKGGVFGQVVGTLACMPPADRARVAGVVVNRFRGDPRLFEDGAAWLAAETGVPVLGVVPWTRDVHLELEDTVAPETVLDPPPPADPGRFHAAVLHLPHISNLSDLDALVRHGVVVHHLSRPRDLSPYDLVILPGSKHTRSDLAWLREEGWAEVLAARDGAVLGLCGGFQLLGEEIADPGGVEGPPGTTPGLGLLPVRTVMVGEKTTRHVRGRLGELPVGGYEIHVGRTEVAGQPLLHLDGPDGPRPEGCRQGRVAGTYLHGLFDGDGVVEALLGPLRPDLSWPRVPSHPAWREQQLDALADHLRGALDLDLLGRLVQRSL